MERGLQEEPVEYGVLMPFLQIFINIWFAIWRLNKYILYAKGLSKGMQATQSAKWNEIYK